MKIGLLFLIAFLLAVFIFAGIIQNQNTDLAYGTGLFISEQKSDSQFLISSWGLGEKKAQVIDNNLIAKTIKNFDLTFIEGFSNPERIQQICEEIKDYECLNFSKFSLFINKKIKVSNLQEQKNDIQGKININNLELKFFNVKFNKENLKNEINELQILADKETKETIILGELLLDCENLNLKKKDIFSDWKWQIQDKQTTSTITSECSYSRILTNKQLSKKTIASGIYIKDLNPENTLNYPVWVSISSI